MSGIIGLTGLMGTGKTSIVDLCNENQKYHVIKLGEYLRRRETSSDYSIENLELKAEQIKSNLEHKSLGEFFLDSINNSLEENKIVIVDSIRTIEDVKFFSKITTNFIMVMIILDEQTRIERLSKRRRNFDPKNIDEIRQHDKWEMDFGIKYIFPLVNKYIINNSLEDSVKEFEEYVCRSELYDSE
ncbi:AAA family ATPase [Clostridium tertium]|uniref:AAA family ATPase n=1 Tax=Clostridium tertium TaxID=1559 RepID=UPI0024B388A9|nr:AAA family ATPase [Clostridium tertium]MDI9216421.1 AAA family ATPase [Clostridium tertium]